MRDRTGLTGVASALVIFAAADCAAPLVVVLVRSLSTPCLIGGRLVSTFAAQPYLTLLANGGAPAQHRGDR